MTTKRRILRVILGLTILAVALPGASWTLGALPGESQVPPEVQRGIENALREKVGALMAEKNDAGQPYKRGIYSKSFKKVDDSTCQVGFHVNTALPGEMVTERYLLTLKGSGSKWTIAKEELQDTYKGLYRLVREDRECARFDSFSFAREGLTVKGSKGSICKGFLNGKVSGFGLAAPDLTYEYTPPVPQEEWTYKMLMKERQPDLVFPPERAFVACDPASCDQILKSAFTGLTEAPLDQMDQALQKFVQENDRETEKNRAENPFSGFRRPFDPERKYYYIGIKKKSITDHWFWLEHDSFEPKEISAGVSTIFGPVHRYYSEQTRASGVPPYELEQRPDSDGRDYDLVSLDGAVELGFGDGETLTGDVTYGLKTKRELKEIPFGIARIFQTEEKKETKNPRMTINSLQDGEGNELTWVRTGLYSGLAVLPKPVPAGTPLTMRLQFENKDSIYKLTPSYSYVDRGGWLPFVRFGDFIDKFDLTVKVPMKYKTLGIGKMVSEEKKDGASITRWTASNPVSFPTIIFGDYIEDTAGFKAKKMDGTEIPVHIHFDKDFMGMYEIAPKSLRKFADDAANALNLFREVYGVDYPYDKLDLVNDPAPLFYGQAPSSLIYLGSPAFYAKGITAGLVEGGSRRSEFTDSLVAHEVAHQWWGSLVANANFGNYWFVESLAEYSAALFVENVYGKDEYVDKVERWRREILEADMRGSVQDGYTVWQGPGGFGPYRAALYSKGPYAFHIMRSTWGDEAFFKFLKKLANDLQGKEIVTRDIQRIAEESFGAKLDWFFDQWLRGVGLPEFTFTYDVRKAEDGSIVVEGEVTQRILMKPALAVKEEIPGKVFTGIVPITIVGKSGKEYRKKLVIEKAKTPFKFNIPELPKEVIFNKHGESLGYDVVVKASS